MKNIKNNTTTNMPIVILARPQLDENMGMVARAMMNCGLSQLRLVNPRDNHLSDKAISAASGAHSILEDAICYSSLEEALNDIHFVLATSARRRDMTKDIFSPKEGIQTIQNKFLQGQKTAFLFGAERTGLENKEIVHANGIIEIPLNPQHASLNLSQAVLLIGYEWYQSMLTLDNSSLKTESVKTITHQELTAFFNHLETELEKRGYFRFEDKKERMSHNLRNIFSRIDLTSSEIKTLHKVVTDLTRKETGK